MDFSRVGLATPPKLKAVAQNRFNHRILGSWLFRLLFYALVVLWNGIYGNRFFLVFNLEYKLV